MLGRHRLTLERGAKHVGLVGEHAFDPGLEKPGHLGGVVHGVGMDVEAPIVRRVDECLIRLCARRADRHRVLAGAVERRRVDGQPDVREEQHKW